VAAFEAVGNYWHMLPEAEQARKAIWNAVNPHTGKRRIDEAFPDTICTKLNNEMLVRFTNGSTWQLVGSDNYNSYVGSTPRGVVFSEWALANPSAWGFIRPILLENGGWALFITTPRGKNHVPAMAKAYRDDPAWFVEELDAVTTGVFTPEQLEAERRAYIAEHGEAEGAALFQQEYMVSYDAAVIGSYFGAEIAKAKAEGRITRVAYDPAVRVETWWDLGVGDSTAIWFVQHVHHEIRVIDHYEMTGEGLAHYAKVLERKPYVYSRHIAPHDISVRELGSGKSRLEMARELGIRFEIAPKLSVDDGINAVRMALPRCWFDADKCDKGLEALKMYRKDYDEKLKVFRDRPRHDWASHTADAFRYGCVARSERAQMREIAMPQFASPMAWAG
jgi:phage terminase large subunit